MLEILLHRKAYGESPEVNVRGARYELLEIEQDSSLQVSIRLLLSIQPYKGNTELRG